MEICKVEMVSAFDSLAHLWLFETFSFPYVFIFVSRNNLPCARSSGMRACHEVAVVFFFCVCFPQWPRQAKQWKVLGFLLLVVTFFFFKQGNYFHLLLMERHNVRLLVSQLQQHSEEILIQQVLSLMFWNFPGISWVSECKFILSPPHFFSCLKVSFL